MARAANLIVALSARNGLCVAGSSPFRKHIAIFGSAILFALVMVRNQRFEWRRREERLGARDRSL